MVTSLKIIKRPRDVPIEDKPIKFPPLENLHLELMENKKKLKEGLPLIPLNSKPTKPIRPLPSVLENNSDKEDFVLEEEEEVQYPPSPPRSRAPNPSPLRSRRSPEASPVRSPLRDDIMDVLGEEDEEVVEEDDYREEEVEHDIEEEDDDPFAGLDPAEREIREKTLYMDKFALLKRKWKGKDIPEFNMHSDITDMKTTYDRTVKDLALDRSVNSYRSYLIGGFIAVEFVATQWIGIDLSGYAMQQISCMDNYEYLLVELGEKNLDSWAANLPVELRLVGSLLFSAAIFYIAKIISSKYGNDMADLFRGFTGQPPVPEPITETREESKPKRKMRGPRINIDDVRTPR